MQYSAFDAGQKRGLLSMDKKFVVHPLMEQNFNCGYLIRLFSVFDHV